MKTSEIKTIDLQVKEWFDKINGNSYYAAIITINFNRKNEKTIKMAFRYGYGNHSEYEAFQAIKKELNCFKKYKDNDSFLRVYKAENIDYYYTKEENCLKSELINI